MNWILVAGVLGAGTMGAFTDWLFMGLLFHQAYNRYPETWWPGVRDGKENGPIIWSSAIGYVMTAAIFVLCDLAGVRSIRSGLVVAVFAFIAGPLAIVIINGLFIRIDPKIMLSHALGYLARFVIAGATAGYLLTTA
jgi:hypothetical protein